MNATSKLHWATGRFDKTGKSGDGVSRRYVKLPVGMGGFNLLLETDGGINLQSSGEETEDGKKRYTKKVLDEAFLEVLPTEDESAALTNFLEELKVYVCAALALIHTCTCSPAPAPAPSAPAPTLTHLHTFTHTHMSFICFLCSVTRL